MPSLAFIVLPSATTTDPQTQLTTSGACGQALHRRNRRTRLRIPTIPAVYSDLKPAGIPT
jgi:hypothetical protein